MELTKFVTRSPFDPQTNCSGFDALEGENVTVICIWVKKSKCAHVGVQTLDKTKFLVHVCLID